MKLVKCPVCLRRFLRQGLKNHIINTAKAEGFKYLNNILDAARGKPYEFSPRVLLNQAPHLDFYRKRSQIIKQQRSPLSFYRIKK
ncbi:hypothetical protein GW932_03845 [archaeon]|nr:hypothetical protein [archaeon]